MEQFLRFRPEHEWAKQDSEGPDTPMVSVTWYDGAGYSNWLSAREGVPEDQWCYERNKAGAYGEGMQMKAGHLGLTGYRLPTEAEWKFACRSGSVVPRYHGRGADLLPRYGWYAGNAKERSWPVGVAAERVGVVGHAGERVRVGGRSGAVIPDWPAGLCI